MAKHAWETVNDAMSKVLKSLTLDSMIEEA
jgi:DNA-binding IscR family transcriptional regulator